MNTKTSKFNPHIRKILFVLFLINTNLFFLGAQSAHLDSLVSWMNYLASDNMKGRQNGSPENEKIAEWIAQKYSSYGLQPLPNQQNFIQSFILRNRNDSMILKNIVGYIPGTDAGRYIVLSAHYDHIGMSNYNTQDSVFNGADDDASGIVTLLGIAQQLKEMNLKPACSIVFAAFSGEEIGLKGSAYFCRSNIIQMEQVKLNLNFELTGRSEENGKNRYYITGPKRSNLEQILSGYNSDKVWQLADIGTKANMLYFMADNFSFTRYTNFTKKNIPAHTFATSVGEEYVHTEEDDARFIDYENLYSLINYVSHLIFKLSANEIVVVHNDN